MFLIMVIFLEGIHKILDRINMRLNCLFIQYSRKHTFNIKYYQITRFGIINLVISTKTMIDIKLLTNQMEKYNSKETNFDTLLITFL